MKKQLLTLLVLLGMSINHAIGQLQINATGANDMRLRTNATDRLNILTNGNVGIGTATPNAKLDIQGDVILKKTQISTIGIQNALDRQNASYIFFSPSGTVTLNGIAGGKEGLILYLVNSTNTTLIIGNVNGSAAFADQILTNTGADITITGRGGATLMWSIDGWRMIGIAQ